MLCADWQHPHRPVTSGPAAGGGQCDVGHSGDDEQERQDHEDRREAPTEAVGCHVPRPYSASLPAPGRRRLEPAGHRRPVRVCRLTVHDPQARGSSSKASGLPRPLGRRTHRPSGPSPLPSGGSHLPAPRSRGKLGGPRRVPLTVAKHFQDDPDGRRDEQQREEVEQAGRPMRQKHLHAVSLPDCADSQCSSVLRWQWPTPTGRGVGHAFVRFRTPLSNGSVLT